MGLRDLSSPVAYQTGRTIRFVGNRTDGVSTYFFRVHGSITSSPGDSGGTNGGTNGGTDDGTELIAIDYSGTRQLAIVPPDTAADWDTYQVLIEGTGNAVKGENTNQGDVIQTVDGNTLIDGGVMGGKDPEFYTITGRILDASINTADTHMEVDGQVVDLTTLPEPEFEEVTSTTTAQQTGDHTPDFVVGDDEDKDAGMGLVGGGGEDLWEFEGRLLQVQVSNGIPPSVFLDGVQVDPNNYNATVVGGDTIDEGPPDSGDGTNGGGGGGGDVDLSDAVYVPFDSASDLDAFTDGNWRVSISNQQAVEGSSLRVDMPEGEHFGSKRSFEFKNHAGILGSDELEEAWAQHWIYFDDSWNFGTTFSNGGKLPGFFGKYSACGSGGDPCDGTDGWSARMAHRPPQSGGDVHLGHYVYHADMQDRNGDTFMWNGHAELNFNQWYRIDQHVVMNTPGSNDAILQGWVDGQLALDKRDLKFRNSGFSNIKINRLHYGVFMGGGWVSTRDCHLYLDELLVSPTPVTNDLEGV